MSSQRDWGRLALSWRQGPRRAQKGLRILAHRGFCACYPENTLSAFAASLGRSHMVELDVRLSADRVVVVCHDDRLSRCSDAATLGPLLGLANDRVDQWRLDQLRRLDMGTWFQSPESRYLPKTREVLPTLAETLAWARAHRMPLNVELKDQHDPVKNALLVTRSAGLIAAAGCTELVLFSSFNLDMLRQARDCAPHISRAFLYAGPPPADLLNLLADIAACACHAEQHDVDAALVARLRQAGVALHVWTVNDPAGWQRLAALGADGLITDHPALAVFPEWF